MYQELRVIEDTLQRAAVDLNRGVDVNHDGKINCIDAAVLFYQYYPDKNKVLILVNKNDSTGMWHLFNMVYVDNGWRGIEPQAAWRNNRSYWMADVWGRQYNKDFNRNVTADYIRYVKL